jgi:DNA polymerase III subunit gamma/tau
MPYKVLYRKYRPQDFNDLYGQDNIKKLLVESIKSNKIAHAYLFNGPRGTGKTSTAKLFAKAINCEHPIDGIPCGKCTACLNYNESPDIIEIDAASNNGVDEIRELRDNIKILPTFSKYKIYIIDEVHMLSQSAWNAFLKTLEEPPKHVIFILATTELQKVPITVLSRCQRYTFKKISNEVIKQNILNISKKEAIDITEDGAEYLSELSDGGMRDALSFLDQLSKEQVKIDKNLIQKYFGLIDDSLIDKIFNDIFIGNIDDFNKNFQYIEDQSLDSNILLNKIINYIYKIELAKLNHNQINLSLESIKEMTLELSNCYYKKESLNMIKIILLSYIYQEKNQINDLETEKNDKIISREIISPVLEKEKNQVISKKVIDLPKKDIQKSLVNIETISQDLIFIRINNSFVNASKEFKEDFKNKWREFKNSMKKTENDILSTIEDLEIEVVSDKNVLFSVEYDSNVTLFNDSVNEIELLFNTATNSDYRMICISSANWNIEKAKYIKNKKNYIYKEEPEIKKKSKITKTELSAKDLFDENIIEME